MNTAMPVLMLDSWQDLLVLLILAVFLFGGSKLAGLGKSAGQALREFRQETQHLQTSASATTSSPGLSSPDQTTDAEATAAPAPASTAAQTSTGVSERAGMPASAAPGITSLGN